jgi:hypothetical protein
MKHKTALKILVLTLTVGSQSCNESAVLTESEKITIRNAIKQNIDEGLEATRNKDIEIYMSRLPEDLKIYDESGEIISREKQREYALRDWAIIDTTLHIQMEIDSIRYISKDSIQVFTFQRWERIMYRRDGITTDTVITTQLHKETWRNTPQGWFGYDILELGGEIFLNGVRYIPGD